MIRTKVIKEQPLASTANAVISGLNRCQLLGLFRFLIALGVDDIKPSTVFEEKASLGDFDGAAALVSGPGSTLRQHSFRAFPLLRRKHRFLRAVDESRRLRLTGRRRFWLLRLADPADPGRAVRYPSSDYRGEVGAQLGRIDAVAALHREKTDRVVFFGCLANPICRRHTLYCTKQVDVAENGAQQSHPQLSQRVTGNQTFFRCGSD